jgi:diguanylate cyclase (GGDEF)-like protein
MRVGYEPIAFAAAEPGWAQLNQASGGADKPPMTTPEAAFEPTWLCPAPGDRLRAVDMDHRLKPVRHLALGILAAALVAGGPWMGWWTLAPLVTVAFVFFLGGRGLEERRRPEYAAAAAWCLSELLVAGSVALSGGPRSPGLAWLVIPIITLPARFRMRGVVAGVVVAVVLLLAVSFGVDAQAVLRNPTSLILTFALMVAMSSLSMALMRSDLDHRSEAVIDPLTSMLNRNALSTRVAELSQQARINHQPVAMILADVDRFKRINDEHGHSVGDAVLRDLAYLIRAELRAYDLAYRIGGEEFLVLLPGGTVENAANIAERLRSAVESSSTCGLTLTMSAGVAASGPGPFDYDAVFRAADQALYAAKAQGRNCVRVDGPGGPAEKPPELVAAVR